jgi:hypothetical protein
MERMEGGPKNDEMQRTRKREKPVDHHILQPPSFGDCHPRAISQPSHNHRQTYQSDTYSLLVMHTWSITQADHLCKICSPPTDIGEWGLWRDDLARRLGKRPSYTTACCLDHTLAHTSSMTEYVPIQCTSTSVLPLSLSRLLG